MAFTSNNLIHVKNAVFLLLGIALVYLLFVTAIDNRLANIEQNAQNHLVEQQTLMTAIAKTTARNGGDAVAASVIQDCNVSDRSRFDALLGDLDTNLSQAELAELDQLFGRCGSFYAMQKSIMVSRLAREVEVYEDYVQQLSLVTEKELSDVYEVETWKTLVEAEKVQSELFSKLVDLQDEIISTLFTGQTIESEEMKTILREVTEVQEALAVANSNASSIRSELVPL